MRKPGDPKKKRNEEKNPCRDVGMRYCFVNSPFGRLFIAGDETGLKHINFVNGKKRLTPQQGWREEHEFFREAIQQLDAYFEGKLMHFTLKLAPHGTRFQLSVLSAVQEVPYGETISYRSLAMRIAKAGAYRAVGAANARNPLPIIIPCHRVIGSNGSLTGYGGGLHIKQALLELERTHRWEEPSL